MIKRFMDQYYKTSIESQIYKVHRINKFNQKTWLKPLIDMNTELRKKSQNESKWINER